MILCDKCKKPLKHSEVFNRASFELCVSCVQKYDAKGKAWVLRK